MNLEQNDSLLDSQLVLTFFWFSPFHQNQPVLDQDLFNDHACTFYIDHWFTYSYGSSGGCLLRCLSCFLLTGAVNIALGVVAVFPVSSVCILFSVEALLGCFWHEHLEQTQACWDMDAHAVRFQKCRSSGIRILTFLWWRKNSP